MYLLESPRRGDSNKYPKRVFSQKITWDSQCKHTRSADLCADRIDVITNFAVITNAVIKRVHCILKVTTHSTTDYRFNICPISPIKESGRQALQ